MPRSCHGDGKGNSKIAQVEHWRGVQVDIAGANPERHNRMHGIGDDILMREHHSFGPSGGSACVKKSEEVFIAAFLVRTNVPGCSSLHELFVMVCTSRCFLSE